MRDYRKRFVMFGPISSIAIPEDENSLLALIRYFTSNEKPVRAPEMHAFWMSCSDEEKEYFRKVDLKTGMLRD